MKKLKPGNVSFQDYRTAAANLAAAREAYEQALAKLVVIERRLAAQGEPTLSIRFTNKALGI